MHERALDDTSILPLVCLYNSVKSSKHIKQINNKHVLGCRSFTITTRRENNGVVKAVGIGSGYWYPRVGKTLINIFLSEIYI